MMKFPKNPTEILMRISLNLWINLQESKSLYCHLFQDHTFCCGFKIYPIEVLDSPSLKQDIS